MGDENDHCKLEPSVTSMPTFFMYFITEKLSIYKKSTDFSILPSAPRYKNSIILILYNALGRK